MSVPVGEWLIETDWTKAETETFCRKYQPWRMNVRFSNGVQTYDFERTNPPNPAPLRKLELFRKWIPEAAFKGRVLDIGHNLGYNSIDVARRDGASAVGIDINPRHQELANQLVSAAGLRADLEFKQADAETYSEPEGFTLVLHLGTLYHLPNPVLSLQTAAANLAPGGWLALETTAYIGAGADDGLNKWMYGFGGDTTNFWALSKQTITEILEISGMTDVEMKREVQMAALKGEMSRVLLIARKGRTA